MPYNYLTFDNNDLNNGIVSASYFGVDDQLLYEQQILNDQKFFGDNNDDVVEISIYSDQEDPLIFNRILPKTTYSVLQGSYRDINDEPKSYNVANPITNYALNFNELLLHTQQDLKLNELSPGLYRVLYNPMRYIAGNPDNRLFIKDISPSRTEIRLSYAFNKTANESSRLDAIKISSFASKKFTFLQLIDEIIPIIQKNPIQDNFVKYNSDNKNLVKYTQLMGFKTTAELQEYINTTYVGYNKNVNLSTNSDVKSINNVIFDGIAKQLKNFVYTYNEIPYSEEEILSVFKLITAKISQDSILKKTTLLQRDLDDILNFFIKVAYEDWLEVEVKKLLNTYRNKFYGLYKNALNFGNGNLVKILDHTSYFNNIDKSINIQLKLDSPLSTRFNIKDTCWISNISLAPIYFKTNLYLAPTSQKVYLNGVNFSVEVNNVRPTNDVPSEYERSLEKSKENLKRKTNDLLIDYTDFSNFVNFSSAELRTKIAKNKIQRYELLENYKKEVISDANSTSNESISASYSFEFKKVVNEQIDILDTFDEFESHLFYNTSSIDTLIDEGIFYDENNYNSLVYQTPGYIKNSTDYGDYLKFVSMVGHMFDNIMVYIKKFPKTYPIDLNDYNDYPSNYVEELLGSFNWDLSNFKFEKSNTSQLYFNNSEATGSLSSSYFDYAKSIFNRITNNLSYIYKTKGSSTSFDVLQNIFGISRGLINVTEYITPSITYTRDIFYDFDDKIYATKYGTDQYVTFDFTSSNYNLVKKSEWTFGSASVSSQNVTRSYVEEFTGASTLEASFRSNQGTKYYFQDKIDIIKKYRNNNVDWRIYLKKTKQKDSANLIFEFSPTEDSSSPIVIQSKELPFFNGDFYTFMLRREPDPNIKFDSNEPVTSSSGLTSSIISYNDFRYVPHVYTLSVNQYYGSQLNFTDTKKANVSYSKNKYWGSGSYYIGNFSSSVQFYGNIDKFKLMKYALSDEDFKEHSYNINSISITNRDLIYENLYYLWSFDTPANLYSGNGMSIIDNQNNRYSSKFYAYNFNQTSVYRGAPYCNNIDSDVFPYQFEEFNIKQAINSNKYGPNYRANANINKVEELVDTTLVPYGYSSYTTDILGSDSNLVGYFISPYSYLNNKIEDFLGKDGINDIIADPKYINSTDYPELKLLRNKFAATGLKYIYPQEFYSTYRFYIDFSIFDLIKKLTPSRSSLKRGYLLEPSLLDRTKFNYKDAIFSIEDASNSSYTLPFNINTRFTQSLTSTLDSSSNFTIPFDYTQLGDLTYNYSHMLIPDRVDDRDFIYSGNGKYVNFTSKGYVVRNLYKNVEKQHYSLFNDRRIDGLTPQNFIRTFTSSFEKVTPIGSGTGTLYVTAFSNVNQITGSSKLMELYSGSFGSGYSNRHLSKFIRVGTRSQKLTVVQSTYGSTTYETYNKGKNTSETTVNRRGILNGSDPIITIPGFLDLDIQSDNFPRYGELSSELGRFNPLKLTASLATSASLETYIMNL